MTGRHARRAAIRQDAAAWACLTAPLLATLALTIGLAR